jgi:hypothetical protein
MPSVLGFSCEPYGSSKLATYKIGDTGVKLSLRRETAPLFVALALEFHRTVERLDPKSCWGHAPRAIRGSKKPSRHWPGIAGDLNATQHPLGKPNTYTPGERAAVDKLLKKFTYRGKRIFRCGKDYTGRKDDQHFEINVDRETALAAVRALQSPAPPKPSTPAKPAPGKPAGRKPGSRELRKGMKGDDVEFVQTFVGPAWCGPADGEFGDRTIAGIRRYQRMRGLTADGIVGKKTWAQMKVKTSY